MKLDQLLAWPAADVRLSTAEIAEAAALLRRAIETAASSEAYCAAVLWKDFLNAELKDLEYTAISWRLRFVRPDRYHVTQAAWNVGREVFDEWISVGGETYRNILSWTRMPDDVAAASMNASLSLDSAQKELAHLQALVPREVHAYVPGNERYLRLRFDALADRKDRADTKLCGPLAEGDCEVSVWIDARTAAIARMTILLRGRAADGQSLHQVQERAFGCYGEPVRVDPPPARAVQ